MKATVNTVSPHSYVRAQKAPRPTQAEIAATLNIAKEKYKNLHRHYEPSIYTR